MLVRLFFRLSVLRVCSQNCIVVKVVAFKVAVVVKVVALEVLLASFFCVQLWVFGVSLLSSRFTFKLPRWVFCLTLWLQNQICFYSKTYKTPALFSSTVSFQITYFKTDWLTSGFDQWSTFARTRLLTIFHTQGQLSSAC